MDLQTRMAHYHVPAVSIAVIDRERIVWSRAWGQAAPGRPATTRTLFQAASLSKPVFAAAALQLVHWGQLDLDKPVNEFLRSWRVPDSEMAPGSAVTLRRLLSHSAGLSTSGFPGYAANARRPSLRQLLDATAPTNSDPVRITAMPGERWRYSGGGTSIAQLAVEEVTGRPLADWMRKTILRQAGMTRSTYAQPLPGAAARFAAHAHDGTGAAIEGRWHIYPEQAAAGLWTTPSDYAGFILWVMKGLSGEGARAEQRFVASNLVEAQPNILPGPGERMGLGLFLRGEGPAASFSHGGSNKGFRSYMIAFPGSGQGAVVMVNGDAGGALLQEVLRALALEYRWPDKMHEMIVPRHLTRAQLAPFTGRWRWGEAENQQVVVTLSEVALVGQRPGDPQIRLVPIDADTFISIDTGSRFRFKGETLTIQPLNRDPIQARRVQSQ
ncbi:MAG: serine hydrolase domain-containing protein [Sphingomicrobium sp.]